MVRLAFLLLGARALRPQWRILAAAGLIWMLLAAAILIDLSDGRLSVVIDTLAVFLLIEGLVELIAAVALGLRGNWAGAGRGLGFLVAAFLVFDVPWDNNIGSAILFGAAFLLDGLFRVASAFVVHSIRWRVGVLTGAVEIVLALVVLSGWPLTHRLTVPFCFALLLLTSGYALLRMGLQLRRLPLGASVTALPLYAARNWHAAGAHPAGASPAPDAGAAVPPGDGQVLRVHVWTATGSAEDPQRRLLVDRYIAAVDRNGVISTGHSALELPPDLYVSHYPAVEIERDPGDFRRTLHSGHQNDVPGEFLPSLAAEAAGWCMPDSGVVFHRFDAAALRAFWRSYSRDATYNLTARNCSSTVVLALDAATEGVLGDGSTWRRFLHLLSDPRFWLLSLVRGRAEEMTWTPGLVLDYARLLQQVTEHGSRRWRTRFGEAVRARRRMAGEDAKAPSRGMA